MEATDCLVSHDEKLFFSFSSPFFKHILFCFGVCFVGWFVVYFTAVVPELMYLILKQNPTFLQLNSIFFLEVSLLIWQGGVASALVSSQLVNKNTYSC